MKVTIEISGPDADALARQHPGATPKDVVKLLVQREVLYVKWLDTYEPKTAFGKWLSEHSDAENMAVFARGKGHA